MKKILLLVVVTLLLTAGMAAAADDASWLTIGGDYRFRFDSLKGTVPNYTGAGMGAGFAPFGAQSGYTVKNEQLMLNRFGLNLKADAVEDVVVKARLVMYKVFGHEESTPVNGSYAGDRAMGTNDGTINHIPKDDVLRVDYAYATVNNVFDKPIWFSVGRRPSTGGIPSNLRENQEKVGTAGIPAILVDYAFDGATLGFAPDIASLPGAYAKLCYGKGFDSGYDHTSAGAANNLKDTTFVGLNAVPYDTEKMHVEVQYQKGWNIFDAPSDYPPTANLGNLEWLGAVVTSKVGDLNVFVSAAQSKSTPNDNSFGGSGYGLLWTSVANGGSGKQNRTGNAIYLGGRYDMGRTKIGAEYNRGSKYWMGFVPAGDDIWTSKLGTRGSVYEVYVIQELNRKPISKKGKAFVRLGYQYYKFDYTGSNFWVGEPVSTGSATSSQLLVPLKDAKDLYLTFDVQF